MTLDEIVRFMQTHHWAIQSSAATSGAPQAALVGFVVTEKLEIFINTMQSSRKLQNLRQNARIALVIGGWHPGDERSVQYEGIVSEPADDELHRLKQIYHGRFPEGAENPDTTGLIYLRIQPEWIRYSDFNGFSPVISEFDKACLHSWGG